MARIEGAFAAVLLSEGKLVGFRDPDGIALELDAPNELWLEARRMLAAGPPDPAVYADFVSRHLGPELLPRPGGTALNE